MDVKFCRLLIFFGLVTLKLTRAQHKVELAKALYQGKFYRIVQERKLIVNSPSAATIKSSRLSRNHAVKKARPAIVPAPARSPGAAETKSMLQELCVDPPNFPFYDDEGDILTCDSYIRYYGYQVCREPLVKLVCCYSCATTKDKAKWKTSIFDPEKMPLVKMKAVHDSGDIL